MEKQEMQNESLLDTATRERLAGRVAVLDKVKELFLLPQLEVMTAQQVADYYEVDLKVVQMCFLRNKNEIRSDGVWKATPKTLVERNLQNVEIVKAQGYTDFVLSDTVTLRIPNVGINLFSKRAVLRIGMLLRDSKIAREVRTQLLNTFEHSTVEQRTEDILTEQEIYLNYARAALDGDKEAVLAAAKDAFDFKNRHIHRLEENNKVLAAEILTWSDRSSLNKAVRYIARATDSAYGSIWRELYGELRYKHGIALSQRGASPYIQHIKEDEWSKVQSSLAAICEKYSLDIQDVVRVSKMNTHETVSERCGA